MSDLDLQLRRLDLEDGDILVLRARGRLTPEAAAAHQDALQGIARSHGFRHVSVLVLDDCSDLAIERPASTAMQHQAAHALPIVSR